MKVLFNPRNACPLCDKQIQQTKYVGIMRSEKEGPVLYMLCGDCGPKSKSPLTQEQLHKIERTLDAALKIQRTTH